jgi:hypothetical protein
MEKMWNVLDKNIYHQGKEDDDGWISFTSNELNHMNNSMICIFKILVRIIKLFICFLWFITKVLSKFTLEQMPSQRIIRNVNIDVQNKLLVGVKFQVARFHECELEGGKGWYLTLLKNTWKILHYLDEWNPRINPSEVWYF